MIEKLEEKGWKPKDFQEMVFKINEIIEEFNKHYHKSLDTQYFTTEPWTKPVKVSGS